jgi:hypothetical protein
MAQITSAVGLLTSPVYNAAVIAVAAGPDLNAIAEGIVNDLSLPDNNLTTVGHNGYYIRAKDSTELSNAWGDVFEKITSCKLDKCIDFDGGADACLQYESQCLPADWDFGAKTCANPIPPP